MLLTFEVTSGEQNYFVEMNVYYLYEPYNFGKVTQQGKELCVCNITLVLGHMQF